VAKVTFQEDTGVPSCACLRINPITHNYNLGQLARNEPGPVTAYSMYCSRATRAGMYHA